MREVRTPRGSSEDTSRLRVIYHAAFLVIGALQCLLFGLMSQQRPTYATPVLGPMACTWGGLGSNRWSRPITAAAEVVTREGCGCGCGVVDGECSSPRCCQRLMINHQLACQLLLALWVVGCEYVGAGVVHLQSLASMRAGPAH